MHCADPGPALTFRPCAEAYAFIMKVMVPRFEIGIWRSLILSPALPI